MDKFEIEKLLEDLPKTYQVLALKSENKRLACEVAELTLEGMIAKKSLELSALLADEPTTGKEKKIKFTVDEDMDIVKQKMEVIRTKSDWKVAEIKADVVNKEIMVACKKADIYMIEARMTGSIEKTNKPIF